jgi:hypothetical protein
VQIEAADLGRGNVNIVGAREVRRDRGAQETKAVGQHFKHAVAENLVSGFRALFQNRKHKFLFAHAACVFYFEFKSNVEKLRDVLGFKIGKMHSNMLGLKKQDPEKNKGKKKKRMFGSGEPRAECE